MMIVTFLTVMPSPYVQDLFAAMAADNRFDLRVLYLEQEAPDTYWGEQEMPDYAEVLPGRWIGIGGARIHCNLTVNQRLKEINSDLVVVVGYIGLTNQMAMRYMIRHQRPWVFWGEIPGFQPRSNFGQRIRSFLQRPLRHAAGIAAVGTRAVESYSTIMKNLGSSDVPIHNIPYHCKLDEFESIERRRDSGPVRFLYCGQLIERKGVDLLLEAFQQLLERDHQAELILAGEGPMRTQWESSLPSHVNSHVTFLGFQPVDKLPEIFHQADVFLLPSRHDGWGVVVNQALGAGLPVIASENVGAAHDLIEHGVNGLRITPNSSAAIFEAMKSFVDDRNFLESASQASSKQAKRISLTVAMNEWHTLFEAALAKTDQHTC